MIIVLPAYTRFGIYNDCYSHSLILLLWSNHDIITIWNREREHLCLFYYIFYYIIVLFLWSNSISCTDVENDCHTHFQKWAKKYKIIDKTEEETNNYLIYLYLFYHLQQLLFLFPCFVVSLLCINIKNNYHINFPKWAKKWKVTNRIEEKTNNYLIYLYLFWYLQQLLFLFFCFIVSLL